MGAIGLTAGLTPSQGPAGPRLSGGAGEQVRLSGEQSQTPSGRGVTLLSAKLGLRRHWLSTVTALYFNVESLGFALKGCLIFGLKYCLKSLIVKGGLCCFNLANFPELQGFFIYTGHKRFLSDGTRRCFLPVSGLSPHLLRGVF